MAEPFDSWADTVAAASRAIPNSQLLNELEKEIREYGRIQGCGDPSCKDPNCTYGQEDTLNK